MSFWDEVKKGLEEGAHALKKGAEVVAEKTEDAAKIAKLRYTIYTVRQSIRKAFTELGAHVFELAERDKPSVWDDEAVLSYIQDVRDGRDKICELEEEIRAIAERGGHQKTPADAGIKEPPEDDAPKQGERDEDEAL